MAPAETSSAQEDVLSGAAFIALLNDIEEGIEPARCVVDGLNIWPILRFEINSNRKLGSADTATDFKVPDLLARLQMWFRRNAPLAKARISEEQQARLNALPDADILFVNRSGQYLHTIPGRAVQPFTDGLSHLVQPDVVSHLTLVNEDARRDEETYLIPPRIMPHSKFKGIRHLRMPDVWRDVVAQKQVLHWVRTVNTILAQHAPSLCLGEARMLQKVEVAFKNIHYFDLVLKAVQPKAIFLSSYTGAYHICAAAKRRGIPVVDIQHGGMHAHHPLAANWHKVPAGGYEVLPDVFWCWSQRTADLIGETLSPAHQTIVGGNPKAALESALYLDMPRSKPPEGRAQVLVALQYGADDLVKPHVLEAYHRTRDTVDWHFRLHPMGWARKDEAVATLGVDPESLLAASRMPLQSQLADMDLLLTNMSTIVHDARDIGVPAAVCSDGGAAFFDDLLRAGRISYVGDVDAVCARIAELDLGPDVRAARQSRATELGEAAIAEIRNGYRAILSQFDIS